MENLEVPGSGDMVHMGMAEARGTEKEVAAGNRTVTACHDNGLEEDQPELVWQVQLLQLEVQWLQYVTFEIQRSRH